MAAKTSFAVPSLPALRLAEQLVGHRLAFGLAILGASAGILAVLAVSSLTGAEPSTLTRDVVAVVDTHLYTGMLSTLGIMLWSATSSLCLLAGLALQRGGERREPSLFLLAAGLLTAALALDDAFLIHERVAPSYLHLPQIGVFLAYGGSMAAFLVFFARRILTTDFLLLGIALGFFAASMSCDVLLAYSRLETFLEDCSKFAGIVFWLAYFAGTAHAMLREECHEAACSR